MRGNFVVYLYTAELVAAKSYCCTHKGVLFSSSLVAAYNEYGLIGG
ncbi:MAG: hypothetical protein WB443_15025 [Nitrososphaeraceae archaeon]